MVEQIGSELYIFQQVIAFEKCKIGADVFRSGVGPEHDKTDIRRDARFAKDRKGALVLIYGGVLFQAIQTALTAAFRPDEDLLETGVDQCGDGFFVNVVDPRFDAESNVQRFQLGGHFHGPFLSLLAGTEKVGVHKVETAVSGFFNDFLNE